MGPEDIASLFFGDEASGPQKAMQLAQALRGQQQLGTLGMLTGDKVLGNVGQHMLQGVGDREALIAKAGTQQNAQRLQLAMAKQEQDAAFNREKYSQGQQDYRQRQALDRSKYVQGPFGVLNTGTGDLTEYAKPGAGTLKPKELDQALRTFREDVDPSSGRGAGLFGKDQGLVTSADKVLALINGPDGRPNYNLTVRQMPELVQSVAAMLSSGNQAAQAQLEHLMPSTASMSLAQKMEWLTGHPEAANAPEFVKQYADTAERERKLAQQRIRDVQLRRLPLHQGLYASAPDVLKAAARQYLPDLSDEDLDAAFKGTLLPKGQQAAGAGAPPREGMVRIRDPKSGRTGWAPKDKLPAGVEVVPG